MIKEHASDTQPAPVTVLVQRRIKPGSEQRFEQLMKEFTDESIRQPGRLGINLIRAASDPSSYTVLDRFATEADRRKFTDSPAYATWMKRLDDVSEVTPVIEEHEGLALWFTLPGSPARKPVKIRMAAVTLLGVYPLSALLPPLVMPFAAGWPLPARQLVVASLIVAALTWVVLPALTKMFHRWLFVERQ